MFNKIWNSLVFLNIWIERSSLKYSSHTLIIYSKSDDIKYKKSLLLIGSIMLFASNQYLALKSFKRLDICIKNIVDVLIWFLAFKQKNL